MASLFLKKLRNWHVLVETVKFGTPDGQVVGGKAVCLSFFLMKFKIHEIH